jgi:Tol biopolymer transport system component
MSDRSTVLLSALVLTLLSGGQALASGAALPPGALVRVRLPQPGGITGLAFSHDGKKLAVVVGERVVVVLEPATGAQQARLGEHRDSITAIAFSPDSKTLTAAGREQVVRVWDITTGLPFRSILLPPEANPAVGLSSDGRLLLYALTDARTSFRSLDTIKGSEIGTTGKRPYSHAGSTIMPSLSADGRLMASWDASGGQLLLWDTGTRRGPLPILGAHKQVRTVAFSANSRMLASADGASSVWEIATGKRRRRLELSGDATALAFSPDGRYLLVGSEAKGNKEETPLQLWDLHLGQALVRFPAHADGVRAVAYAPDGKRVASGGPDGTVLVWDVSAQQARKMPDPKGLATKELESLLTEMSSADAAKAYDAVCAITASSARGVEFLRQHLLVGVDSEPMAKRVARLIEELGHQRFAVRERALGELRQIGEEAAPALRQALVGTPSEEVRRRLELVLAGLGKWEEVPLSPGQVRVVRALEVLENVGSREARQILQRLAEFGNDAWLRREAAACLQRLSRLQSAKRQAPET